MKKLRPARISDKEQFRALWDISFNDSREFSDWFFDKRFVPDYCALIEEEDGFISSEVQSLPVFLKVRGAVIPSAIMVGACTHPDFKRRGYMKELYTYYMNMISGLGVVLCPHTPAVLRTYYYVGHYPVSDTAFIEAEESKGAEITEDAVQLELAENMSAVYKCYQLASRRFSGIVCRSYADFALKCADYLSCGAKCVGITDGGNVLAYAVYFDDKDGIHGEEIMALDETSEQKAVNYLFNLGKGRKVSVKLPPDTKTEYNGGIKRIGPRNVCGIADVGAFLKAVGKNLPYAVEIKDDAVPENNGVFNFSGERTTNRPQLSMTVYRFAQWMFGYRSLNELIQMSEAVTLDSRAGEELDRFFPKQVCHIIDEY
ncbi:GNAT family N-acetyltransferase [Lachnospiraceae bacterium NSJ-143]|nr:GNAT family N-acetyltransferase [Lachnospiraceae bacterium NSJ-143]